jgi:hypothetical protein
VLSLVSGWSQEFRNDAAHAGDRELRRTAHRLHMPEERLKNARTVLRKVTDLAGTLDPVPPESLSQIAEAWVQLDRDRAPGAIETLYAQLATSAAKASDEQKYQQATLTAQGLLTPLADLDYEKALQLVRQWPAPPESQGAEADHQGQLEAQFRNQLVQRMTYTDPGMALQLLPGIDASKPPDYSIRGQVALQLGRNGDTQQADRIVEQVIADFKQRSPDAQSVAEYANFLMSLSMMDSNLFREAFAVLQPILTDQTLGTAFSSTVQVGDSSIVLSPAELSIMNLFRGLQGRPQLAVSTLDALPDLRSKLESIGGLDNFLNPNFTSGPTSDANAASDGDGAADAARQPARRKDTADSLYAELRGKLRKTPGKVRSRLSEVASDPARLELLIGLAQRAVLQDPDLSSLALKEASEHLQEVDPIQRRVPVLEMLVSTYRQCLGEVDPELIRSGFVVSDKLRQAEEQESSAGGTPGVTQADQLEATLVSEYARDDFDAAMRFLRSKPDDSIKIISLMRVVEALRSGY